MEVIGIDPGLNGGIASWNGHTLSLVEIPTLKAAKRGNEVDWAALVYDLDSEIPFPDHAFIELVHSMPQEGVASAFKFGFVCGGLRGIFVARNVPLTYVTPGVWKKALGLNAAKDAAIARASQLFPGYASAFRGPRGGLKDGIAEAALIAWYGYNKLTKSEVS